MSREKITMKNGGVCEFLFCEECVSVHIYLSKPYVYIDWHPFDGIRVMENKGVAFQYYQLEVLAEKAVEIWRTGIKALRNRTRERISERVDILVKEAIKKSRDNDDKTPL